MNNALQKELAKMLKEDQKASKNYNEKILKHNTGRLKEIIKEFGWPSSKLVGINGEYAAWLVVQHSDHNIKFQEKCLRLLEKLQKTKPRKKIIAYLTDRILVNKGKKQIYGTQFCDGKPKPLNDTKNLDKLRRKMNLGSFENYKRIMQRYS